MNLKPINTYYGNCYFRSRHEARWAVFFDELNIKWEYELEGFELPPYKFDRDGFIAKHTINKTSHDPIFDELNDLANYLEKLASKSLRYLPDFWLPELNLWAEVKHDSSFRKNFLIDYEKMMRFVNYNRESCLLCTDLKKPLIMMNANDKMGNLNFYEFSLTTDDTKLDRARQKALSARFEFRI